MDSVFIHMVCPHGLSVIIYCIPVSELTVCVKWLLSYDDNVIIPPHPLIVALNTDNVRV